VSIHRHKASFRSILFNRRYIDDGTANPDNPANLDAAYVNSDFYLDSLDISRVSVQDYREMRQFLEGGEPNEAYEGVRALNGVGRIVALDQADLEDKTWALNEAMSVAACRVAAVAADPIGVLPFSFKRDTSPVSGIEKIPATKALRFYCRPGPGRPVAIGRIREGLIRPFSFQLIAFDPFAYDEVLTQTTLTGTGGPVVNPGNIYTRPRIVIKMLGAGNVNFTISNATTGKKLVLNMDAAAATTYTIDTARGTFVRTDTGANVYSWRVSGFITDQWLQPGSNTIDLTNVLNVDSVRFDFRGAWA